MRYPVLYVLHGYGQDPRDLEAVAIFTNNFMNVAQRSYATRLPKFIIVYVDGRCRVRADGKPECIRGTFYMNSARPDGAQLDGWFDEVTRVHRQELPHDAAERSRSPGLSVQPTTSWKSSWMTTSSPSIATRYVRWSPHRPFGRSSLPFARSNT